MKANIINKHKGDPGWAEVVRLYSGLFDTEKEREIFIIDLASTNIVLSAECKLTSINDEDLILDQLIEKAFYSFRDYNDYFSLLTLLTLNEYSIIVDLFNYKYKISITDNIPRLAILNGADPFTFISYLEKYLPKEEYGKIVQFMSSNVSEKNKNYYLLLLKNLSEDRIDDVYTEIKNSVFNTDEDLLGLLLSKCSAKKAYDLYCEIKLDRNTPGVAVINSLLAVSDPEKIFTYFQEFEKYKLKPNLSTLNILLNKHYTEKPYQIISGITAGLKMEQTIKNVKKFQKAWVSVIVFYDDYTTIKESYDNLIILSENYFESAIFKDSEVKIICHLIRKSPNYNTAKYWYCFAVEKYYEVKVSKALVHNFLPKFENQSINIFIRTNIDDIIYKQSGRIEENCIYDQKHHGNLFKNLPHKYLTFQTYCYLMDRMRDLGITIPIQILIMLIERFNENKELEYLCSLLMGSPEIHPKIITSLFMKLPINVSLLITKILKENTYDLSIIHYNTILRKCTSYDLAMQILTDIKDSRLNPDKFTFTNLIPTCQTTGQLIDILYQCTNYNVESDSYLEFAISSKLKKISGPDFSDIFRTKSNTLYKDLSIQYFNILNVYYHECTFKK